MGGNGKQDQCDDFERFSGTSKNQADCGYNEPTGEEESQYLVHDHFSFYYVVGTVSTREAVFVAKRRKEKLPLPEAMTVLCKKSIKPDIS